MHDYQAGQIVCSYRLFALSLAPFGCLLGKHASKGVLLLVRIQRGLALRIQALCSWAAMHVLYFDNIVSAVAGYGFFSGVHPQHGDPAAAQAGLAYGESHSRIEG
jgi:hypothetical protein